MHNQEKRRILVFHLHGAVETRDFSHEDGLYQGRFVNRFGKKQTVYAKTLNEVRQKLRNEQYEDEKGLSTQRK